MKSGWSMARWMRLAPTCSASMAARSRWPSSLGGGGQGDQRPAGHGRRLRRMVSHRPVARDELGAAVQQRAQHRRVDVAAGDARRRSSRPAAGRDGAGRPAAATAPLGSATSRACRIRRLVASAISSSVTVMMSCTWVRMCSHGSSPTLNVRSPSAIVRRGLGGRPRDAPAGPERFGRVAGEFGFDADHLGVRQQGGDRRGDPGDQSATGHRDENRCDVGHVEGDLQPDGALAGDDIGMVERRDHRLAGLLGEFGRPAEALLDGDQFDGRPEVAGGLDLADRGVVRDDDVRVDAERPRGVGDRLGVIAGGMRQHAAGPDGRIEPGDGGHRAADLERADRLQVLGLEPQPGPGRGQQWRPHGVGPDQLRRVADQVDVDQSQAHQVSPAGSGSALAGRSPTAGSRSRTRRGHRPGRWPHRRCLPATGCRHRRCV